MKPKFQTHAEHVLNQMGRTLEEWDYLALDVMECTQINIDEIEMVLRMTLGAKGDYERADISVVTSDYQCSLTNPLQVIVPVAEFFPLFNTREYAHMKETNMPFRLNGVQTSPSVLEGDKFIIILSLTEEEGSSSASAEPQVEIEKPEEGLFTLVHLLDLLEETEETREDIQKIDILVEDMVRLRGCTNHRLLIKTKQDYHIKGEWNDLLEAYYPPVVVKFCEETSMDELRSFFDKDMLAFIDEYRPLLVFNGEPLDIDAFLSGYGRLPFGMNTDT